MNARLSKVLAIPTLLFTVGCHAHVNLDAPTATASSRERLAAYERLRAISMHETHITYMRGNVAVGAERRTDYLQLEGGERVYHPEDVRPVVREGSPTWRSIDDYESSGNVITGLLIGGFVAVGAGTAISTAALVTNDGDGVPPLVWAGVGVGGAGIIALAILPFIVQLQNDEKATVFETYNKSLIDNLDLCVVGDDAVKPCEDLDAVGEPEEEEEPAPKKKKKKKKKKSSEVEESEPDEAGEDGDDPASEGGDDTAGDDTESGDESSGDDSDGDG